jgi:putative ABC transport system permease protein
MWKATLKGLLAHKVRLALTALAVVLGVGFVVGTYVLTDTMNRAFDDLFRVINKGVAVQVQAVPKFTATGPGGQDAGTPERVPGSLVDRIKQVPGVRTAEGTLAGYAQLVAKDGKAVTTGGAPTLGVSTVTDPELSGTTVRAGRRPQTAGEIAIDAHTAQKYGFQLGDRVKVLLQGPPTEATIVGIFGFGSADNLGGATLVAFDSQTAQVALNGGGNYDTIDVAARPGVVPTDLRDRIQQILPSGVEAKTGAEAAQASANDIKKALSFFNIALLVFAGISLFVGAFIIFNTFSILIAQRTRELALLRALGASPAQVRRSVMAESLIVGVVASAIGIVAGLGIAVGLKGLLRAFGIVLPTASTAVLPRTIIAALIVGVGTTVVSAVAPAMRASRVPPLAAIREAQPAEYRRSARRTLTGGIITLLGIGVLSLGLFAGKGAASVGFGAALVFFGVAVLSPLVAGPMARAIGAPLPRISGVSGKLGRENAMRNPRRTASTAAALMIGLGLVSFVSIFAASIKASSTVALEQTLKADYIVSSPQFQGFSQDIAHQLQASAAFSSVAAFRIGTFGYQGRAQQLSGVDPSELSGVATVNMEAGSVSALGDGDVLVYKQTAASNGWKLGTTIPVQFARTGAQPLVVVGIYTDNRLLGNYLVSLGTYETNFTEQLDFFVLAKTAPGASQAQARAAIDGVSKAFPNVKIEDQVQFRQSQAKQIDQLLGLVTALLGLAIIIALFGIVNTLALSIFERTHELGLLRAVGMARRQVRSMVRWEAIIIAVFGAILGTAVGVFFGWAMVRALRSQGITVLSLPVGQLLTYVAVSGLMGVVAAAFPARRAARLDVLKAIAQE